MNSVIKQHPLYKLSKISIIELIMSEYVHCDEIPTQIDVDTIELNKELQECKERSVKQRAEIVSLTEKLTNVRSQLSASVSMNENVLPEGAFQIQIDGGDNVSENDFSPNPTQTEEIDALTQTNLKLYSTIDKMNLDHEAEIEMLKQEGNADGDSADKLWMENDQYKKENENLSGYLDKLNGENNKYKKMLRLLNELLLETTN